jgi:hypothetical protein
VARRTADIATMAYMDRFRCIGTDCEDNCCYGWRVEIDHQTYKKMVMLTTLDSREERLHWDTNIIKSKLPPTEKHRRPKGISYALKMLPNDNCPMLMDNGWCHVQFKYGEKLLSDTCATYPRRINLVGEQVELTGMMSCPEITRQLIMHADSTERVMIPAARLPRPGISGGMDPRDVRPYWRLLHHVREFMLATIHSRTYSLEKRLLFLTFFSKRTSAILNKKVMRGDKEKVLREIELMKEPKVLAEMERRFDGLETPSMLVLLLARELVRRNSSGRTRDTYKEMVTRIFQSYEKLRALIPDDATDTAVVPTDIVWAEYKQRKERVLARAAARVDQIFTNYAYNFCVHRLPVEAPDLMTLMLRMLTQMAALKFLFFSFPTLMAEDLDEAAYLTAVDKAAVEVFYKTARYMDHSTLLSNLENGLAKKEMRNLGGALHLVRF